MSRPEDAETVKDISLWELFFEFFKLGAFTIGGGMAMVSLIQGIVVDKKKWLTEEECVDCLAVSQGLPGVIAINMATYIGNVKRGTIGSIVATAGVMLPSLIVIMLIVEFLRGFGDNHYVKGALKAIRPAAAALIAWAAIKLGSKVLKGRKILPWVLAAASFLVITFTDISAVWAIVAGIAAGIIYTRVNDRRAAESAEASGAGEKEGGDDIS